MNVHGAHKLAGKDPGHGLDILLVAMLAVPKSFDGYFFSPHPFLVAIEVQRGGQEGFPGVIPLDLHLAGIAAFDPEVPFVRWS